MAALPYMQLYVADYLADTAHLNAEEHGAYLLLLMNYWQRGKPLVDDNERLAIVARTLNERWTTVRKALEEFFDIRDGFWFHNRMERDLEKVNSQTSAASRAGKASAKARQDKKLERPFNDRSTTVQQATERSLNHTDTDTDTDTDHKKPSRDKRERTADPRHEPFREMLSKAWKVKNPTTEMPWGPGEAKQLSLLLSAVPSLDESTFRQLLHNRHKSEVNHAESPLKWIRKLTDFGGGPLNQYGKPMNPPAMMPKRIYIGQEAAS